MFNNISERHRRMGFSNKVKKKENKIPKIIGNSLLILFAGFAIFIIVDFIRINVNIEEPIEANISEEIGTSKIQEYSVSEILANPELYNNKRILVYGYLCNETADNTGLAWLTDEKMMKRDECKHIIRVEGEKPFEYSYLALYAYGTLKYNKEERSISLTDSELYKYNGDNKQLLKNNALIDADILNVVTTAVRYNDTTNVSEELQTIINIVCAYEDESFEDTIMKIKDLAEKKQSISKTDFETEAEQLWDLFIAQFLVT